MHVKFLLVLFSLGFFSGINPPSHIAPPSEQICGKWESSEKNLIVQVYCEDNKFKAKIIWFINSGGKPLDTWTDFRNPDESLRSRKILGMSVLNDLCYKPDTNSWEDGMIYDAEHGRDWNASAYIDKNGILKVKGYWHFKFIGKTMTFNRV
jgi:uncharacterized protein (DUF2147 family)